MTDLLVILSFILISVLLVWILVLINRLNRDKEASDALKQDMQRLLIQQENSDKALRDEFHKLRTELMTMTAGNREEIRLTLESLSESLSRRMNDLNSGMQDQMQRIRDNNEKKLEEMRHTVDEKLQQTLESRLGESFRQVSERLEQVHKGLGEMKVLATDVGDLKKVLSNVSTRGAMGELQLEKIISQLLSPEQYEKLYKPRPRSPEVVEFAIKLPGKDEGEGTVYLPIDSKFPLEDYHNLVQAYESGNPAAIEQYRKALIIRIKSSARDIRDKYINPPATTDFALLFLPIEGLFAEALRDPAVFETIQREMHVILTGPTTLAAILNSLQLGFRSLAIEKRSSEVWRILGAVKTEFSKFGGYLDKTKKKLEEAHKSLDDASDRTRHIERKLKNVQEISYTESVDELGFVSLDSIDDEPEES